MWQTLLVVVVVGVAKGGRVEITTAADGSQGGNCIFPDGSSCEEWAYFRGECAPAKPTATPTPAPMRAPGPRAPSAARPIAGARWSSACDRIRSVDSRHAT